MKLTYTLSRLSLIILATLLIARITAPELIKAAVNQKLADTEGIDGHIADIDLSLFRGAYQIQGLELFLQKNTSKVPSIAANELDISLMWGALFRGAIIAEIQIDNTTLVFIDNAQQENDIKEQAKRSDTWLNLIDFASPVSVDQVDVSNTKFVLINQLGDKQQKNYVNNIHGQIFNITNTREFSGNKITKFSFTGDFMGQANATFQGALNPETVLPTFDVNFTMQKLPVSYLDSLIDLYTPIDLEQGKVDAAAEIIAVNGQIEGYIKAGIYEPNIFNWKSDITQDQDGLLNGIFEALIDGFANIFQSGQHDLVAINIPINGTVSQTEVSMWDTFVSLFYNAFVNEYEIIVDNSVSLEDQQLDLLPNKNSTKD